MQVNLSFLSSLSYLYPAWLFWEQRETELAVLVCGSALFSLFYHGHGELNYQMQDEFFAITLSLMCTAMLAVLTRECVRGIIQFSEYAKMMLWTVMGALCYVVATHYPETYPILHSLWHVLTAMGLAQLAHLWKQTAICAKNQDPGKK